MFFYQKFIILLATLFIISCNSQENNLETPPSLNKQDLTSSDKILDSNLSAGNKDAHVDKSIREIDFKNFAYPICPNRNRKIISRAKEIPIKEGRLEIKKGQLGSGEDLIYELANISYHDLTNDNREEAVITLGIRYFQGWENCTFIYSLKSVTPSLLWTNEFGYGPDSGIRKLAFENSGLLVEHYTKVGGVEAVCCPEAFSRILYKWNGEKFVITKSEVLPNESKENVFLGYPKSN